MTKYYIIEVSFNRNNKWERIGERYPLLHQAVDEEIRLDLTYPTRICKITKTIAFSEVREKRHGKRQNKVNKAHPKRITFSRRELQGDE